MSKLNNENRTRQIDPKLGLLGILGFLGIGGIWTYQISGALFPFMFFGFFGFFGFFFEGKLSGTLMDERFLENRAKAQLNAYRVGFMLMFIIVLAVANGWIGRTMDFAAIFLTISFSLIFALVIFLSEYLLYQYDFKNQGGE